MDFESELVNTIRSTAANVTGGYMIPDCCTVWKKLRFADADNKGADNV